MSPCYEQSHETAAALDTDAPVHIVPGAPVLDEWLSEYGDEAFQRYLRDVLAGFDLAAGARQPVVHVHLGDGSTVRADLETGERAWVAP